MLSKFRSYFPAKYRHLIVAIIAAFALLIAVTAISDLTTGLGSALVAGLLVFAALSLWPLLRLEYMKRQATKLTLKRQPDNDRETFTSWSQWPVDASTREAVEKFRASTLDEQEIVLAHFDKDGRVITHFGALPALRGVDQANFSIRERFPLSIVLIGDYVLVRKDFISQHERFIHEWYNLAILSKRANVPAIYRADEKNLRLYKNLIYGTTLRDILVQSGAKILIVDTDHDGELMRLDKQARLEAVWKRGQEHFSMCFSEMFWEDLEQQVRQIHSLGIAGLSLTFGNIMKDARTGAPWLIDFEGARSYGTTLNPLFRIKQSEDLEKFQRIYGREMRTESGH